MQILPGGSDEEIPDLIEWVCKRTGPGAWRDELDQVLSIRSRHSGGLWYWSPVVVSEQLLWALPRNGNFADQDLPGVLTAMCGFLTVIDQHPDADTSVPGAELAAHARSLEAQFVTAMHTLGRWGPNRRMMAGMGVDFTDVAEMAQVQRRLNRATREYNSLSSVERARISGPTIAPGMEIVGHDYLPLTAAPAAECEQAARESRLLQQIAQLAGYLGDGITLTAKGNIPLAAGRDLVRLLETSDEFDPVIGNRTFKTQSTQELRHLMDIVDLASAAGFITKRKTILRASGKARTLAGDPVAAVSALLRVGVDRGWHHSRDSTIVTFGAYCTQAALLDLYEVREPMTVANILGVTGQRLRATFDLYQDSPSQYSLINATYGAGVLNSLDLMAELNVLTIDPPGSLTRRREDLVTAHLRDLRDGGASIETSSADSIHAEIDLTALGLTLVQPWAAKYGTAPLVEAVEGDDPVKVLAIAANRTGENAPYELSQWLRDASPTQRAALTVQALGSQSEVTRSVALRALIGCEEPTTSSTLALAATEIGSDDQEAPQRLWAWALIADSERHIDDIALEPLDDDRWITLISETLATLGPDHVQPWLNAETVTARAQRIDRIWRLDRPELGDVLAAAAEHDPDSHNRKQARKSLFKLRQRT